MLRGGEGGVEHVGRCEWGCGGEDEHRGRGGVGTTVCLGGGRWAGSGSGAAPAPLCRSCRSETTGLNRSRDVSTPTVGEDEREPIRNDAEEDTMTTNAFGGQGGYPVPLVPVNLKDDQDVNPHADEPRDASEEEVNEEAAVAENIESAESDAAIENLKPGAGPS